MKLPLTLALLPCLAWAQLDRVGAPNSNYALLKNPTAVEAGERRFLAMCTACHGRTGEGGQGEGQGPNLMTSWEVRRALDNDLLASIRNGVKGTAMPAFALPDDQVRELAAFVRSLNAPAVSVPVQGDASAGEAVFLGKGGCADCHMILGRGGFLGPDLSNVGASRRLNEIREAIVSPKSEATSGFRPLLLIVPGGPPLRGVAKHESHWSLQILDERGTLHLLHGPNTASAHFQPESWMRTAMNKIQLSPEEVQNLLAFLARSTVGGTRTGGTVN